VEIDEMSLGRVCRRMGWHISLACLVLLVVAAREPIVSFSFIEKFDSSAAVILGLPALCLAQMFLLLLSEHHLRQSIIAGTSDRLPFSSIPWVKQSTPHSSWILNFVFYWFPVITLVDLLVTMNGFHIVSYSGTVVATDLTGWNLFTFPSEWQTGGVWRWCVNGCSPGCSMQAVRRSAYPGAQPFLYLVLFSAVLFKTVRFQWKCRQGQKECK
jgi:hypothetical protein